MYCPLVKPPVFIINKMKDCLFWTFSNQIRNPCEEKKSELSDDATLIKLTLMLKQGLDYRKFISLEIFK